MTRDLPCHSPSAHPPAGGTHIHTQGAPLEGRGVRERSTDSVLTDVHVAPTGRRGTALPPQARMALPSPRLRALPAALPMSEVPISWEPSALTREGGVSHDCGWATGNLIAAL